ncbi:hypothetical protein HPP92_017009 [Vanilla planifolia]|uniref:GDSL esterase/lipase At5g55050-like n=1 Tax=Vanilla planifolia TaxID=51239 RepID=A0A835USL9_VANPL|nr:hypothetical protein HPP92_017009 [Vanilla planifolia]
MGPLHLLILFLFFLIPTKGSAQKTAYVFGDSLADVGNNNYLLTLLKANFPYNGIDFAGGKSTGRYSNGKNSIDFIAEQLGIASPPPYLAIASSPNNSDAFLRGVNFASGGAGIFDTTNKGQCLSFNKQIAYFSTVCSAMAEREGSIETQNHLARSIFALLIGSNDILAYLNDNDKVTPQQFVSLLVSTLQGQLKKLYNLGARKFVFVGTGPIGCSPAQRRQSKTEDCNASANFLCDLYNHAVASLLQETKSELGDLSYSFFNSSLAMLQLIQKPYDYGLTEVKTACCGLGELNAKVACTPISAHCGSRNSYLFWDFYHPTEAVSRILAAEIFEGSAPLVYPVNVRELEDL